MYVVMNSRRIQELRKEKDLSKQELAAAAGISRGTLRHALRERPVRKKTARKVAAALEVNLRSIAQPQYTADRLPVARAYAAEIVLSKNS
jgi:transcriptional regulator with XRE-family HTH domain